jgi:DnaJ family protein C protein 13
MTAETDSLNQLQKNLERPIVLRKRRERVKSVGNWQLLYYMFTQDHAKPNLIWNYKVSADHS